MEILWKSSFNQAYITKLILGKNILIILLYIKYSMHVINKLYAFKSTTFCSYILQARNLMASVYSLSQKNVDISMCVVSALHFRFILILKSNDLKFFI